jgi:peptidoglycan/xylan/chitin deacetylase (PgdA/CDA1 family)
MIRFRLQWHLAVLCFCATGLAGCDSPKVAAADPAERSPKQASKPARVTDRPPNLKGSVLILEYHKISKSEARWDRSIERFRGDLKRLHRMGFRPVTLRSYLDGTSDLPPGASPVIFTFDDSHSSQFRVLADGSIDPDCAVGIWQAFAKEHPDFPVRATFFVLPPTPWGQPGALDFKLSKLREWGCEIGSHTLTHRNLAKLSNEDVAKELAGSQRWIRSLGFHAFAVALPFGVSPRKKSLLEHCEWNGSRWGYSAAMLVGAGPAPAPGSVTLDAMRLPRIQSIEGDYGITYWLDRIESGSTAVYVQP